MAREAGAVKVYMASAAPPVRYQNVYGIDMPAVAEFVANSLFYQSYKLIRDSLIIPKKIIHHNEADENN
ncbi:MAG: hypothetical protein DRQ51_07320 [Gammaproteobacteria bacterium]|nr:MAG: hypothetical protein DRQ51_07320 [Gammaproteobacteria bacterium]